MRSLTPEQVRASFINVSQRERGAVPVNAAPVADTERLDFLGWRDPASNRLAYVVGIVDDAPVGIMLREVPGGLRAPAQCAWCEDVLLPNDVVPFNVKRSGRAGRNGDSVGTLVCSQFECSRNVRVPPREAYLGFDVEAERQRRIEVLQSRVTRFLRDIRDGRQAA